MKRRVCNTAEAKAKLNQYLNEVEAGVEVIIQRRGKTVAKLVPASSETLDDRAETIRFMTRLRALHQNHPIKSGPQDSVVALLRELREES